MFQWNEVYPYNAVHVVRIPKPLEVNRVSQVVNSLLETCGLTHLGIDRSKGTFHYHGGPVAHPIKVIEGKGDLGLALSSEIEGQLNAPFADAVTINPFRFFALPEKNCFYLGLVYLHPISGAESIVFLLKSIVNIYMGKADVNDHLCPNLYPGGYLGLFKITLKSLLGWLCTLPSLISDLRSSFRVSYKDAGDHTIGFSLFSVDQDQFLALARVAKLWGVTLNDIFLALLLKSLSPFAMDRMSSPRRRRISIASIVNIRRDLSLDIRDPFGLFLGSFIVSHAVPGGINLETLARDIRRQTVRI